MKLTIDFHCHLLPGVDDGAKTAEESSAMLQKLASQGIRQVYATPHFVSHIQKQTRFLEKRDEALSKLRPLLPDGLSLVPAAEVALENGISESCELKKLTMGNSPYLLLELPFAGPFSWLEHEIDNIRYGNGLFPIFAHIERYAGLYNKSLFEKILSTEDAVFQFTNGALKDRSVQKLFRRLCDEGLPVLMGSDAHGSDTRPPDFDSLSPLLDKLFKKGVPDSFHTLD